MYRNIVLIVLATLISHVLSSSYSYHESKDDESSKVVEDADKIVDELWYAFNEGKRPPTSSSDATENKEILESSKEIKQSELLESLIPVLRTESSFDDDAPSTVVVYGSRSGLTSMRILDAVPKSTVLSVEGREKYRDSHLRRRQKAESKGKDLRSNLIAKDAGENDDSFTDIIVLEDMSDLINGRLPHEFEEWIASLFKKSRAIVILDSIPKARYFKYWSSTMNLVLSALSVSDVSADVRHVEFKKKVGWGYDSDDLERAIVVIRDDVTKREHGGYHGDSSYYDPDTSTEFHIGKSSADTVIRPNTKGLRRCSNEPVDNDSGDRFKVIVTRDFISVTRKDKRGSGWGQDLKLLCKTTGSFHRDDWNEPHNDVSSHLFTTWYFSTSKLRSHGLISEDRGRVFMSLLRSMPSMPFLRDSELNVVRSNDDDNENEYDSSSNIKIRDVDLYYGAGVFRFAIQKKSYDGTTSISLVGTEVHENVPRRREDLERLNEDESRRKMRRSSDEYESVSLNGDEKKKNDKDDEKKNNVDDDTSSSDIQDLMKIASAEDTPSRAQRLHAKLNEILEDNIPLDTVESMTDAELDQLELEIQRVLDAKKSKAQADDDDADSSSSSSTSRRILSIFGTRDSQQIRAREAVSSLYMRRVDEAIAKGETVPKMPQMLSESKWHDEREFKSMNRASAKQVSRQDRSHFRRAWRSIEPELRAEVEGTDAEPWTSLVYGSSPDLELMALRMARSWPQSSNQARNSGATVLSAVTNEDRAKSQLAMAELLGLENLPVCLLPDLSPETSSALTKYPDQRFAFLVLGLDVAWGPLLDASSDLLAAEQHLGSLLGLGSTVFLEVPSAQELMASLWLIGDQDETEKDIPESVVAMRKLWNRWSKALGEDDRSDDSNPDRFVTAAIAAAVSSVRGDDGDVSEPVRIRFLDSDFEDEDEDTSSVDDALPTRWVRVDMPRSDKAHTSREAGESFVSLYTMLHLNVVDKLKAELFRLFLRLHPPSSLKDRPDDLARAFQPWNVRFRPGDGDQVEAVFMPAPYPGISNGMRMGKWWTSVLEVLESEEKSRMKQAEEEATRLRRRLQQVRSTNSATSQDRRLFQELMKRGGDIASDAFEDPEVAQSLREEHSLIKKIEMRETFMKAKGQFSFLEWNSGAGDMSVAVASSFPNATVFSVARDEDSALTHLERLRENEVTNNVLCVSSDSETPFAEDTLRKLHDSPELVRFQMIGSSFLELLHETNSIHDLGTTLGLLFTLGLTSFIQMPHPAILSLALTTFFDTKNNNRPDRSKYPEQYDIRLHPHEQYKHSSIRLLRSVSRLSAGNRVSLRTVDHTHLVRVDIVNMTRTVGHHFGWRQDGHDRKYKMRVVASRETEEWKNGLVSTLPLGSHRNNGAIVSVGLERAHDKLQIPYVSLWGMTLIAVLRMGLIKEQRAASYYSFVHMPLYEDMAPWNIVFQGSDLEYIDYDTKDKTFDKSVRLVYQVLSVLYNYKRTVEDFEKCGRKGKNGPYNFPHVSECVGSWFEGPCDDSARPVPCGDGTCHTDYISCLRSLSDKVMEKKRKESEELDGGDSSHDGDGFSSFLRGASRGESSEGFEGEWSYDSRGFKKEK